MRERWNEPGALARRYAPAVYRLAYARTGCQADAEDVMQEVFLRLVKAAPVFDSEDHARAWLLRVASNCANDLFRLPWRRREAPLADDLPAGGPGDGERDGSGALAARPVPDSHPSVLLRGPFGGGDCQNHREKRGDGEVPSVSGPQSAAGAVEGGGAG